MESRQGGKSQRKRLQRQLEFYLSESNLRQDKFLQEAMDELGFVPVRVFLSFNKLKTLKATERMILDEADKSSMIRVDRARSCIAPKVVPTAGQDHEADVRTIYFDSFDTADDHDSLRRTFSKFGKVNLVSLPRFPQSKKFKGFGFVEFSDQSAAEQAVAKPSDAALRGIRVMNKTRWLEMKEQLKHRLSSVEAIASGHGINSNGQDELKNIDLANSAAAVKEQKKKRRRKQAASGHIHFGYDEAEEEMLSDDAVETHEAAKKQKV